MAVATYYDTYGQYPPSAVAGLDGRPWHSWRVLILPYLEHNELYKAYDFGEPWDGPHNRLLAEKMPRTYAFHGTHRPEKTTTNYLAVVGDSTVWRGTPVTMDDVTDGVLSTILIVENNGAGVHWMEPRDLALDSLDLHLNSPGGVSSPYENPAVVTVGGYVHRLRSTLQPTVLRALLTINGGENLDPNGLNGWDLLPDGRDRSLASPGSR